MNVRVAMARAHSFKHRPKLTATLLSGRVVQAIRVKVPPNQNAYEGKDGQIIIEFDQIESLLSSIAAQAEKRQRDNNNISESIKAYVSHPATAELVLNNPTAFQDYLKKVSSDSPDDTLPFVIGALDTVWKRAIEAQGSMSRDRYCAVLVWTLQNLRDILDHLRSSCWRSD